MLKKFLIFFLLIISIKIVHGTTNDIPINFEITEDAINLFLLKQYNDLGDSRYIEGSLGEEDYYVGLLPFTVDLLNDEIRLNWGFELKLSSYPNNISFTDVITLGLPSGKFTVKLIFQEFESLVNSLNLPDIIENAIISRFKNIQLFIYYDELIKDVQNEEFYKQHPVELVDPYFEFGWDVKINKLIITISTKLQAEAPKMEMKIVDNANLICRLNFEGRLEYINFNGDNNSVRTYADFLNVFPASKEHEVWHMGNSNDYYNCIVHITTDTHVYQGYFDIDGVSKGVWFEPYLLIK
jgi:hypothetical protein